MKSIFHVVPKSFNQFQMLENVEATAEVSKTFNEKIGKYCDMTLLSCACAGKGNVLKVQSLLGHCAQHLDKTETHQGPAVLGIAMVAVAEELGLEMAICSLEHMLQYGEQNIRRAVPLALGLICISNPKVNVMDTLSRLSHDSDSEVALAAIVALGLIGAGTNNSRITSMLRNLSSYYYKMLHRCSVFPGKALGASICSGAPQADAPAPAAFEATPADDDDDHHFDLFGDETEEEKKAAEERETAKKATFKKKESDLSIGITLVLHEFVY